jgi:hypothetical protein
MPIQEDYLSTSLRWSLFKTDNPEGAIEFYEASASELGIPARFLKSKDEMFCVAKITRYAGDSNAVIAYKSQNDAGKNIDSDAWHVLCSKAMGRALKKAGYPDTMADLKTMMKFRSAGKEQVVQQPNVSFTTVSNTANTADAKTTVAGFAVESNKVEMESKERPSKPSSDWGSDIERDEAHRNFKIRANDLSESEKETLRVEHEKLNNRQWPMPRTDLNTLIILLENMRAENESEVDSVEVEEDEADLLDIQPLKAMFILLGEKAQEEVIAAYGPPSDWADKVPEHEYSQMIDLFGIVAEEK